MKRFLVSLTLVATVTAAPAVAQTYQGGQDPQPSATVEHQVETTMTGTVVSSNTTELILQTAEGQKTIQLSDVTAPPADLSEGSQVTVTYRDVDGQLVASHVAVGEGAQDTGAWATAPPAPSDEDPMARSEMPTGDYRSNATAADAQADVARDDEYSAVPDTDVTAVADADADVDLLPATASEVPLLALLGALSLGAALVLRRVH